MVNTISKYRRECIIHIMTPKDGRKETYSFARYLDTSMLFGWLMGSLANSVRLSRFLIQALLTIGQARPQYACQVSYSSTPASCLYNALIPLF